MKVGSARTALPEARSTARRIGAGRAVIAAAILAAPVPSARLLGADTATARRVTWLTRMMAVRDAAVGVGTLAAARRPAEAMPRALVPWLVAGAASDAVDALVIAAALKQGRVRGVVRAGIVAGAAGTAALQLVTAVQLRRA